MSTSPRKPTRPKPASSSSSNDIPTTPIRPPTFDYHLAHTSPDQHQHISPTKAAALTRLQHDINTLTSWLESLFYPSCIPAHLLRWRDEALVQSANVDGILMAHDTPTRNTPGAASGRGASSDSILEALKVLKQINLSADQLRSLVHSAEVEELQWLEDLRGQAQRQRAKGMPARILLDELHRSLSVEGREALESLSQGAVMLGLELQPGDNNAGNSPGSGDMSTLFATRIIEQARRKLVLEEQVRELGMLQRSIDGRSVLQNDEHGSETRFGDGDVHDEQAEQIHAQTVQFNRDTKQINLKIMEYEDRVRALERQLVGLRTESADLQELLDARRLVEEKKANVAALLQRLAAFHGLPPELEPSRSEVRRAVNELAALKRTREELFGRMGNI